jgi:HK97 gp10 family phage protein
VATEWDVSQVLRLAADLGKTSAETTTRASAAVRKSALDIERDAKTKAPVDTGNLRNSIGTTTTLAGLEAQIGPTANYGAFVEYGTSRMGPQPYMGPALDANEPAFVAAMEALGRDAL